MRPWMSRQQHRALQILGGIALGWLAAGAWQAQRPEPAEGPTEAVAWSERLARARRVDLNTSSAAELERLPGIGPRLAQQIVAHRAAHGTFHTPAQLMEVSGIGPATYERVRDRLMVP